MWISLKKTLLGRPIKGALSNNPGKIQIYYKAVAMVGTENRGRRQQIRGYLEEKHKKTGITGCAIQVGIQPPLLTRELWMVLL